MVVLLIIFCSYLVDGIIYPLRIFQLVRFIVLVYSVFLRFGFCRSDHLFHLFVVRIVSLTNLFISDLYSMCSCQIYHNFGIVFQFVGYWFMYV